MKSCAPGFTKSQQGFYLGYCEEDSLCNCNGHSIECDESGRCLVRLLLDSIENLKNLKTQYFQNCQDNTMGNSCETCISGYVKDNFGNCRLGII